MCIRDSASSHALSVSGEITLREVEFEGAKKAYECDGTPADCVKLGIDMLKQEGVIIDVVYAGINHGGNLGTDTMYSGTVSAAAEGMMAGLPAVAVSVNSHEASYFEGACRLAVQTLPLAMSLGRKGVISCLLYTSCDGNVRYGESVFSEHTLDRKIPGAFKGHVICLESLEYTAKMTGYLLRSCAYDYLFRLAGDAPGRVHISCYLMAEGRLPLRIALEEEEIGVLVVDFGGALLSLIHISKILYGTTHAERAEL